MRQRINVHAICFTCNGDKKRSGWYCYKCQQIHDAGVKAAVKKAVSK